jgi:hypothetical protein
MRRWALYAAIAAGAAGCASASKPGGAMDTSPPVVDASVVDASVSDDSSSGGDSARGDTGTASESGAAESGAADSGPGEAGGDAGPRPAECNPSLMWSTVALVPSIAPAGFDRFGSISSNALTVAWTSSSSGAIFVADRPSVSAPFGTPAQLDTGGVALATGRVALADSGLRLVATLATGSSFVSFVRASAGGSWTRSASNEFTFVAAMVAEGGMMSEPVVSADGLALFYLLTIGKGTGPLPILYESTWTAPTKKWSSGTPLPNPEFAIASASQRRRPTGASADRRTLFFFDEVAAKERAAWRASPTAPFDTFVDVTLAPEAAPDANCDTLYFGGAGQGLFTASRP